MCLLSLSLSSFGLVLRWFTRCEFGLPLVDSAAAAAAAAAADDDDAGGEGSSSTTSKGGEG